MHILHIFSSSLLVFSTVSLIFLILLPMKQNKTYLRIELKFNLLRH